VPPGDEEYCQSRVVEPYRLSKVSRVVAGGETRQASVACGLERTSASMVVIHDAARPFVTPDLIRRVVEAAAVSGAAIAAVPITDTMKRRGQDPALLDTVDREGLWAAQTPQAFLRSVLVDALTRANAEGFVATDDAGLVERLGLPVAIVQGHPMNVKITTVEDFHIAQGLASAQPALSGDAV